MEKVIDINLSSTFYLCKHAIKKMLKNKYGRIVNIISIVGHTGNLGQSNYAASKAAWCNVKKFSNRICKKILLLIVFLQVLFNQI